MSDKKILGMNPDEFSEEDEDRDDDGSLDVQHYPIPPALKNWLLQAMTEAELAEMLGGESDDEDSSDEDGADDDDEEN